MIAIMYVILIDIEKYDYGVGREKKNYSKRFMSCCEMP